ncbi:BppU family phage baseplate upper protein [Enterococcus casseliflavus]|uniref:BppU family phage baseplate upper protein n=1 Tax=Enterococcus casseliflavus TaxID=37734 RepID=UPI0039A5334F
MAVKYPITLSVSEPNNNIGLLKVRQADEESQTLVVQILEDAVPKSYKDLQVFFCARIGQTAGLGIIEQKLNPEEMTDPKNGKLEYTLRAEDWQVLGRQNAYFSFRKMSDDHTFVQQFSTRDFTFEVTKSIYSDGIKEVTKDGSTYVWTFEDLLRLLQEFKDSGETDFLVWFDEIKDQLSEDAAGNLMLLYQSLRDKTGKDSDFREFEADKSFMRRVFNESAERGINVKWFGARGDGQTDDTEAIQRAIDYAAENNFFKVKIPDGVYLIKAWDETSTSTTYLRDTGGIALKDNLTLELSDGTILKVPENPYDAYNVIRICNKKNVSIFGGKITGDISDHTGTTGEWGYGIAVMGSSNVTIKNISLENCWGDGLNLQYFNNLDNANVIIKNVVSKNNRRQGMSIESGVGVKVMDCVFVETGQEKYTAPGAGVDIEPATLNAKVDDVTFSNCIFEKNYSSGLVIMGSNINDIKVKDCEFKSNFDLEAQMKTYKQPTKIRVENTHFIGSETSSTIGLLIQNCSKFTVANCEFDECGIRVHSVNDGKATEVKVIENVITFGKVKKLIYPFEVTSDSSNIYVANLLVENVADLKGNVTSNIACRIGGNKVMLVDSIFINLHVGLYVAGNNNTIKNNLFLLTAFYGMRISGTMNIVTNNTFSGTNHGTPNGYAIQVSQDKNYLVNNINLQDSILPFADNTYPQELSHGIKLTVPTSAKNFEFTAIDNPVVLKKNSSSLFSRREKEVYIENPENLTDRSKVLVNLDQRFGAGTTQERPIEASEGDTFFDTTLGKPIFCRNRTKYNGGSIEFAAIWVDANGTIV